jgi:hypothetical protein
MLYCSGPPCEYGASTCLLCGMSLHVPSCTAQPKFPKQPASLDVPTSSMQLNPQSTNGSHSSWTAN